MTKVKLKRKDEIDFNKYSANFHVGYEAAKDKLDGRKTYLIYDSYHFYGTDMVHLKDMKGNIIKDSWGVAAFRALFFKVVR